jgi:hypothetical protein
MHTSANAERGAAWGCCSFSDYFRLMLTHVGLAGWQQAFTPTGLHPATRAWLRLVDPSRLTVDTLPTRRAAPVEAEARSQEARKR